VSEPTTEITALTARIVAAYVARAAVAVDDVSTLITTVHASLSLLGRSEPTDAVPIREPAQDVVFSPLLVESPGLSSFRSEVRCHKGPVSR